MVSGGIPASCALGEPPGGTRGLCTCCLPLRHATKAAALPPQGSPAEKKGCLAAKGVFFCCFFYESFTYVLLRLLFGFSICLTYPMMHSARAAHGAPDRSAFRA